MNYNEQQDNQLRNIAWGIIFIIIGALSLVPGDQSALAVLGCGGILVALNLWRALNRFPVNAFTLICGGVAFITGAVALLNQNLGLHFEIELFPVVLIAIGIYILWPRASTDGNLQR